MPNFLITALDLYFEHKKIFPKPSKAEDGEVLVSLPISVVAKMLLLNTMVSSNIRISDLARKMNINANSAALLKISSIDGKSHMPQIKPATEPITQATTRAAIVLPSPFFHLYMLSPP